MKKTRFLVLALAVAIMMMGAGYAWWTQEVKIDSDITTGYMDVNVTDISVTAFSDGMETDKAIVDCGAGANLKFLKMYPGATGTAVITFTNNSTMPVKLSDTVAFDPDFTDENGVNWLWFNDDQTVAITVATAEGDPGTSLTYNATTKKFIYGGADIIVPVSGTIKFTVSATMNTSNGNDTQKMDKIGFDLTPKFIQWNDTVN